jgi:hypothetical protein
MAQRANPHPGRSTPSSPTPGSARRSSRCKSSGRGGVATGLVGSEPGAPAFGSRFCRTRALVPDFVTDPKGYVEGVLEVCEAHRPRAVLPMHDGSIDALQARPEEVERLGGLALAAPDALDAATDKARTFAAAREVGVRFRAAR